MLLQEFYSYLGITEVSKKLNLNEMIQFVLDKANHPSGDRRMENIVKTAINTAYMNFARVDCDIENLK